MNAKDPEKLFLENVQGLLDQGAENLESQTERRLEEIRAGALIAVDEKCPRFFLLRRWVLAGGFAMATLAAAALLFFLYPSTETLPTGDLEDLEIITSRERLDIYQNLDFYRWLGSQDNQVRPNGRGV
jgi:hypothetical protein